MKHEIDITDEMVQRARDALPYKSTTLKEVRVALEAAMRPQPQNRRFTDSQREERRAAVEAPHGAEESKCEHEWLGPTIMWGVFCCKCGKTRPDKRNAQRRRNYWLAHKPGRRDGAIVDRRKPLDATRRPPNPTPDIYVSEGMKRAGLEVWSAPVGGPVETYRAMELKRREESQ